MNALILSPRAALRLAMFLAIVLCLTIIWASSHAPVVRHSVLIDDCALVLDRTGRQVCR